MLDRSERRLVGNSARSLLGGAGGVARARRSRNARQLDSAVWAQMAALGWSGMLIPQALGGCGMAMADALELFHALGETLAPEPVPAVIAATCALAQVATDEAATLLARIVSGDLVTLFAPDEAAAAIPAAGPRLNGCTGLRTDLYAADGVIFLARTADGPALFGVDCAHEGVDRELRDTVDGGATGRLRFRDVDTACLAVLARGQAATAAAQYAADLERLANAATLVGVMDRALGIAVDHLRTRHQFGKPIGSFQALQHRAASCHVDVAASRAIVHEAALAVDGPRRRGAAAAAKAYVGDAALRVTREAIQFHGAIGFTDEHDIGLFHRRALALAAADGGPAAARATWSAERGHFGDP